MQTFQDQLDGRGDRGRIATDVEPGNGGSNAVEMAQLMDVVERRHQLRGVDRQAVVKGQDEGVKIAHREEAVEDGRAGTLKELVDNLILADLAQPLDLDLAGRRGNDSRQI